MLYSYRPEEKPCTSIADTKCSEFYGYSSFPNRVSQDFNSSINTLSLYRGLYTLGCSKYMQIYLCLALMPTCDDPMGLSEKLGPCESLCLLVTQNCSNVLQNVIGDNDISCLFTDCKRYIHQLENAPSSATVYALGWIMHPILYMHKRENMVLLSL